MCARGREREKLMDLIFWMGELECIQFYLSISSLLETVRPQTFKDVLAS